MAVRMKVTRQAGDGDGDGALLSLPKSRTQHTCCLFTRMTFPVRKTKSTDQVLKEVQAKLRMLKNSRLLILCLIFHFPPLISYHTALCL